jgi:hypothetical protein
MCMWWTASDEDTSLSSADRSHISPQRTVPDPSVTTVIDSPSIDLVKDAYCDICGRREEMCDRLAVCYIGSPSKCPKF